MFVYLSIIRHKTILMILSIIDYTLEFHPNKSTRTVLRMVKSGLMPVNHIRIKGFDKPIMIQIVENDSLELHYYCFIVDYLRTNKVNHETAAAFCCENILNMPLFCKLAKIK